jgi:hypothetical protein
LFSGQIAGLFQGLVAAELEGYGPPAGEIVPVQVALAARPDDLKAAGIRDVLGAVGNDANSLDHIHDLSPFNWRVMQSASHHFAPQVFNSLFNQRVIGWPIHVWSISLDLLFDVFVKQGDAMVG